MASSHVSGFNETVHTQMVGQELTLKVLRYAKSSVKKSVMQSTCTNTAPIHVRTISIEATVAILIFFLQRIPLTAAWLKGMRER